MSVLGISSLSISFLVGILVIFDNIVLIVLRAKDLSVGMRFEISMAACHDNDSLTLFVNQRLFGEYPNS